MNETLAMHLSAADRSTRVVTTNNYFETYRDVLMICDGVLITISSADWTLAKWPT